MTKWEYRRLIVCNLGFVNNGRAFRELDRDDRGWYWDTPISWRDSYLAQSLKSKMYGKAGVFGGPSPTRLPLNPSRDWENVPVGEAIAWDEDVGYADLAMEVMSKMGEAAWELVAVRDSIYFFKRPVE